ncbi:MAG: DUF3592 domain-containing protein [Clostridium sp.]|nr:DUF3592 domain-containing protein [Clostridium sp.]
MLRNKDGEEYDFQRNKALKTDDASKWILIFVIFMGLMIMIFSVVEFVDSYKKTADYEKCEATVVYCSKEGDSKIIRVTYQVDDVIYQTTASDNISSNVDKGDIRYVKYDSKNPQNSVIITYDSNIIVFVIGLTFAGIALVLVLFKKGYEAKIINRIISALIIVDAIVLIAGLCYVQGTLNPIKIVSSYPISIVMYLGFIAGIVFYLIRRRAKTSYILELIEKKEINGKYLYIFECSTARVDWLRFYAYYSTEKIDMFEEIEKFKVKIGENCIIDKNEELKDTPYTTLIDISTVKIEDFIPKK